MFNPDIQDFTNKYNELKSSTLMSEYYGISSSTILNFAKTIGYKNVYRSELNADEIKYVCDNYYFKKSIDLANELNVSKSYICKIWKINGLKGKSRRSYYINFNYFHNVDTFDKAYFLGIIASDGCIYNRDEAHQQMLTLTFNKQDEEIIYSFLLHTKSNYKPYIMNDIISLQVNSDLIVDDLRKYNITERKTKTYEPYILENEDLMWHYIRGYFDGDGSIYNLNKKSTSPCNWFISFCGNYSTMKIFQDFFYNYNIKAYLYKDNRLNKYTMDFYDLRIRENKSKEAFIKLLYKDSDNIRLSRKYFKALKYLELLNNNIKGDYK